MTLALDTDRGEHGAGIVTRLMASGQQLAGRLENVLELLFRPSLER